MKIISIRRGFATNSSSSHSLVFVSDDNRNDLDDKKPCFSGDYGWDYFVQKSFSEKLAYIMVAFPAHDDSDLIHDLGVTQEQIDFSRQQYSISDHSYIDHESAGMIPSINFAKTVLYNDNIAIIGGNDNNEEPEWYKRLSVIDAKHQESLSRLHSEMIQKGDKRMVTVDRYDFVTILEEDVITEFDSWTGEKTRYSLKADGGEVYLSTPELVDIKITDYCPYGCDYCYQNSTEDGLHANWDYLADMVNNMKDVGVLELAIGGGEPTLYPQFDKLIDLCLEKNENGMKIIPNFTTRNLSVFKKGGTKKILKLLESIGGFAYSIDNKVDAKKFFTIVSRYLTLAEKIGQNGDCDNQKDKEKFGDYHEIATLLMRKVSFQIVLGTMSEKEYVALIQYIADKTRDTFDSQLALQDIALSRTSRASPWGYRKSDKTIRPFKSSFVPTVMLLGYKTTGRGSQPTYDYTGNALTQAISIAKDTSFLQIGIDTACAMQMGADIKANNIAPETYYSKEGVASCYIDAVAKTMASSSYCPEIENGQMDAYEHESFTSHFRRYQKKGINAIPMMAIHS